MNADTVTSLAMQALTITLEVSMPFLLTGLAVGLVVSVLQAVTSIQEPTLTFIPKILATGAVMPTPLIDLFITINICAALMILITTMYVPQALDFSVFPSLLLITTLFRLGINISVTRLVLLHADAGGVIHAFGSFVVGGNVLVGLVVFLIIVVIQFVVITNGAGRVAEVAARFTLDAMLQRVRELAVQYNNGTLSASDKASITAEVSQLCAEISRIGNDTKFNNIAVLTGSSAITFQVGADDGQTISVSAVALFGAGSTFKVDSAIFNFGTTVTLASIDAAIQGVSDARSTFGSVQNRLEHSLNNLATFQENLTSSESRIRDVDMDWRSAIRPRTSR